MEEAPIPEIGPLDVLIKIKDSHLWYRSPHL